ncbi:helix-turn-helix domain-containing protein [Lacticaseibacillus hulanensis]|uniref:helix-turn-helix domain-containing protein n=1 Tax=Lacticaseibacillus hulanensis TaxID=2493111 RepID=UPI000FDA6920|nr:helix-turn-helix transcriptional regulator [Lacticaseibacillus hulanensis]
MALFDRVKETSKKRGWSLQETATHAGLGLNSLYAWKKKTPSADRIQAVADVLNVSVDYLLGNTDDPQVHSSSTPSWATDDDKADLKKFLEDDAASSLNFGGRELTPGERRQLNVALTQIFWEELEGEKAQKRGDAE